MWYKKKKVWTAIITCIADLVAAITGHEELIEPITIIGGVLIGGLGLEDFGKAAKS